jgi:hypothetical protein
MSRRESPFASGLPEDSGLDVLENRNDQLLSALSDKSRQLLDLSRSVRGTLSDDRAHLEALSTSMNTGTDLVVRGRAAFSSITNDPTYFGVCKIAIFVFLALVIIRLFLKFGWWLVRGKRAGET